MCVCARECKWIAAGNFYIGFYITEGKLKVEDGADRFMDIDKKKNVILCYL